MGASTHSNTTITYLSKALPHRRRFICGQVLLVLTGLHRCYRLGCVALFERSDVGLGYPDGSALMITEGAGHRHVPGLAVGH